jgi:AraC family transcriptional regulator of adaptative response / DNA-3-methyladenine glycosylase II
MDLHPDACYRTLLTGEARFDGRLFVGAKTTGIYCRPICPARHRQNVTFFDTATAAQAAGFRPCLRCRPESSPDPGAWRGTSNTVARALALIEAGALDAEDVEGLAARLGVGEHQPRRLFHKPLGASPRLRRPDPAGAAGQAAGPRDPMAEVALAAGFGGVQRFNETFQALFDRPLAALRRMKGEAGHAGEHRRGCGEAHRLFALHCHRFRSRPADGDPRRQAGPPHRHRALSPPIGPQASPASSRPLGPCR